MLRLRFNERQSDQIKVWLAPAARDWILVGIAEGTAAYNTISGNMETASAADREEGLQDDGRVAFFAKGRIKGDFLLTAAYDSAREKKDARERLQGTIEPDRYYLLYGDGTDQRFEAASQSKLYLKIERRQFVALFGDFDTGFTVTELTKYNRSLSGLRADFGGERVQISGFAARTAQSAPATPAVSTGSLQALWSVPSRRSAKCFVDWQNDVVADIQVTGGPVSVFGRVSEDDDFVPLSDRRGVRLQEVTTGLYYVDAPLHSIQPIASDTATVAIVLARA
jgi:hypothetical protein